MGTTVHIAVDHKIHTSRLVNINNFNVVFPVVFPFVNAFISNKAKHLGELVAALIVTPKFSLLDKAYNISLFIAGKLHLTVPDAQLDIIIVERLIFRPENLIHGPLIVQEIHPVVCIADSVILFYIIVFHLPIYSYGCHQIIKNHHGIGIVYLF